MAKMANNVNKYVNGKPTKTVEGASPAKGKPAKTSVFDGGNNQLPAVGPLTVGGSTNKGGSTKMNKQKGY